MEAIYLFVNASKGLSAVQIFRDLDVQHKTAFVLMHKLREALAADVREVEVDGAAIGGHVRPANRSEKHRVMVVLHLRSGRTLTRPFLKEAQGVDFARQRIAPCSVISADEAAHWDQLAPDVGLQNIHQSQACSLDGAHTNHAESFFSRLKRMTGGQHLKLEGHSISAPMLPMPHGLRATRGRATVIWRIA